MNALTLTLIRVAFLAVLWLFVIAAIGVVRTDLLGTVATKLRRGRNQMAPMPAPQPDRGPKARPGDAALPRRNRGRPVRREHRPGGPAGDDGPGE